LNIANSTFSGNHSAAGGGIDSHAPLSVLNSTFSGNSATNGGGINSPAGEATVVNSTLSDNSAVTGGGINGGTGSTTLANSIVANSLAGGDCAGAISDGGHNLSSDTSCGFDPANGSLPDADPLLGPLQNNGGATWTHALPENSPAVGQGITLSAPPPTSATSCAPLTATKMAKQPARWARTSCRRRFIFTRWHNLPPMYQAQSLSTA
jgi:hypothetical protein